MFANTFQSGFISIFYSVGSNPLQLWDKQVKNGHIRRVVDDEVRSLVLEISGTNVATTYITCPIKPRLSLGIKLPFLVMIIKNMKKYFTFEIQILDDKDMHRRFRVSNFQSTTKVRPFCTTMPIGLSSGWNQVQFNLADFTKRAYGSTYLETTRVQIHANVRIRRIYFSDVLYSDDELPNEYKLFLPTPGTQTPARPSKVVADKRESKDKKEEKKPSAEEIKPPVAQEVPSAAPPSPAGPETPVAEPEEAPAAEPELAAETEISVVVAEPPSEAEEVAETTTEAPTEETTEAPTEETTEAPTEAEPAENAEVSVAPIEGANEEAPPETAAPEVEAPPVAVEETPVEEQPPAEEKPPVEEPAAEAPPAEEQAPVEEAAAEAS